MVKDVQLRTLLPLIPSIIINKSNKQMGNNQSSNWEEQYHLGDVLGQNHLRVRQKSNPNLYYEVYSLYITFNQQSQFLKRVRQRQADQNTYIQKLIHCNQKHQRNICGNTSRFNLIYSQSSPTIADHCRIRRARKQQFSPYQICHVIRNITQGLAYLKSINESHGSVNLNSIIANKEIYLADPLLAQQMVEDMGYGRNISFPSPQKLRGYYDILINFDEYASDLFSLGVVALQMQHLDRDMQDIYSIKHAAYHNTCINYGIVSQLIAGIRDPILQEWIWVLLNPDERGRLKIHQLINQLQINTKTLRILKENPLKVKPEEQLMEQIDPYVEAAHTNKNMVAQENPLLKKSESLAHVTSNRPSLIMPISHQDVRQTYTARPTFVNALSIDSRIQFSGINNSNNSWNPNNQITYATQRSNSLQRNASQKVTHAPTPQHNYFQPPPSNQKEPVYLTSFPPNRVQPQPQPNFSFMGSSNIDLKGLSESLSKLSLNLKSFIDLQSQQLSRKRQNMVIYDVNSTHHEKAHPAKQQKEQSKPPPVTPPKRLQFRKASSLYTDKLTPTIHEVQEEHSNLTENEYVIEQYQIGTKYEGFKRNGKRNGTGKFFYSEGSCYDGEWKDNKMHGFGVLTYPNGSIAYQGEWRDDEFEGKGVIYNDDPVPIAGMLKYADLTDTQGAWIMYEGGMEKGKRSGHGKLTFINGQYFEGEFKDDEITGNGSFYCLNGNKITGKWASNILVEVYQ